MQLRKYYFEIFKVLLLFLKKASSHPTARQTIAFIGHMPMTREKHKFK